MTFARLALAATLLVAAATANAQDTWHAERVTAQGRATAIDNFNGDVRVKIGDVWFTPISKGKTVTLEPAQAPQRPPLPANALSDSRVATGKDIARAWLADPTPRYDHGVLGDAIEAGTLVIERRDGKRESVTLNADAVFEDLEPRVADLDGDGIAEVVTIKSYLKRGSSLAVIGRRDGRATVLAETPPFGHAHRWLNPAGIADFTGEGAMSVAMVAMPHAVGRLELWTFRNGKLVKVTETMGTANHAIGTRVLHMSAVADFDGDKIADLAVPSFDRRALRLIAFAPKLRDIARVALPGKIVTEVALLRDAGGSAMLLMGLDDGALMTVRR
jgi:hypothetical protein